jgi:hypothetical protein
MKSFWKGLFDGFIIGIPPSFLLVAYAGVSPWVAFVSIAYVVILTTQSVRRFK